MSRHEKWWLLSIGNGDSQHLSEQKPLSRSRQKFVQLISSARPSSRPKLIMIGGGRGSPYRWSCRLAEFFGDYSGKRTADPERSSPTYYTLIDAVSAKDVPFGGLIDTSHPIGELSPTTPHFGTSMGIAILNVYGRISAQDKRITVTTDI
jgi:hypothetical protein